MRQFQAGGIQLRNAFGFEFPVRRVELNGLHGVLHFFPQRFHALAGAGFGTAIQGDHRVFHDQALGLRIVDDQER